METGFFRLPEGNIKMFKSYYVVWKLFFMLFYFIFFCLFKSYYVVWKPCVGTTPTLAFVFKSYYVVWKLYRIFIYSFSPCGLNRTMQYGNLFFQLSTLKCAATCLNRTMQYGNCPMRCVPIYPLESLNRTMQYGNNHELLCRLRYKDCLNRTMQYGNRFSKST